MESRLIWSEFRSGFAPRDAMVLWRRDAVLQAGGFSSSSVDPTLDMMIRLQSNETSGCVIRNSEIFGHAEPRSVLTSTRQMSHRVVSALQALAQWNDAGRPARLALGYYFVSQVITPVAQAWVAGAAIVGAFVGWLPWGDVALTLILLSFGNAILSDAALLLRGSSPDAPEGTALKRLLLIAPVEFVLSYALTVYAIVSGGLGLHASVEEAAQ
jgi:hypothetical protein